MTLAAPVTRPSLRLGRRHVDFPGGPAAYLERGAAGVPLLLIHGFGGDALSWQFNLTALAAGRRVLAVDMPAHGESSLDAGDGSIGALAGWMIRFLDALGLERIDLAGHSMGARVALEMAARHPGRVRRVSLLACAGLGTGVDIGFLRAMADLATMEDAALAVERLFARSSPYRDTFARALLARMTTRDARAPLSAMLEQVHEAVRTGAGFDWTGFAIPCQLIWGTQDRIVPPPHPESVPVPVHLLEDAGHMPHVEAASRVNDIIKAFHA